MKTATEESTKSDGNRMPSSSTDNSGSTTDVIADDEHDADGQLASKDFILDGIVSQFPQDHLVHCFGYGSGVFSQSLTKDQVGANAGMLDLILVVEDTLGFHKENMQRFPHHYATWLRSGGPNLVTRMQKQGLPWLRDAHVLFHVVDEDQDNNLPKMKYGVVDKSDLVRDLVEWDSLYLAGRLHKPTLPIVSRDEDVLRAQNTNLTAAAAAALLLSSPTTTDTEEAAASPMPWLDLYRQIAALSYTGDFRMQVGGEDPLKLDKLVQAPGQLQRFHDLYRPILASYETSGLLSTCYSNGGGIEWNPRNPSTISHLRRQLPASLRETTGRNSSDHELLAKALSAIVAPAARNQSFKGIFTLGFRKSIQYASAKLSKGLLSRK